ncbi:Protein rogdi [Galemys pyrenaicus]|uniref:Protein rogdi homolog n=1 Tax=Galemys pyrenaicus TaxID=202257 RepID=A0A8J5ZUD0_GALPY|nr:Protein rogdi [Galemys pyrenaicus]
MRRPGVQRARLCRQRLGPAGRNRVRAAAGLVPGRPRRLEPGRPNRRRPIAGTEPARGRGWRLNPPIGGRGRWPESGAGSRSANGRRGAGPGAASGRADGGSVTVAARRAAAMATAMAATAAERAVLEEEFRWLLRDEVHAVLRQLQDILKEASLRFTLPGSGSEGPTKQENFILGSCGTDQVKGVLTLQGDALSQADVNLKMPRNNQLLHFAFREDKQWKLQQPRAYGLESGQRHRRSPTVSTAAGPVCAQGAQCCCVQIQDARNHVSQAVHLLANRDESCQFRTGAEVLKLMDAVMLQLSRARNRLTTPATLTLPEIAASGLTRMFAPALPSDLLVNVYISLNKLCLTLYQLHTLQPNSTKNFRPAGGAVLHSPGAMFEWGSQRLEVSHVHKVECVVPWLNDALVFFTVSLQLCQQLKDKISVFSSYWSCRPF